MHGGQLSEPRECVRIVRFGMGDGSISLVRIGTETLAGIRPDERMSRPLAAAPLMAEPAGIHPIHQPGGWVGLSEGEGQDTARAWWIRPVDRATEGTGLRVVDAGWDDWVLSDADPLGSRIITTSHDGGRLVTRSFPHDLRGRTAEEIRTSNCLVLA